MSDALRDVNNIPCLPVDAPRTGGKSSIGTGFLVGKRGRLWLVTAAHVATHDPPTLHWESWPRIIRLWDSEKASGPLSLFEEILGTRKPKFISHPSAEGRLHDFLALEISPHAADPGQALSRFHVIRDCPRSNPAAGARLVGFGFPNKAEAWPYAEPDQFTGSFLHRGNRAVHIQAEVRNGHSGGPVFTSDGSFLGMTIGGVNLPDGEEQVLLAAGDWIWDQLP